MHEDGCCCWLLERHYGRRPFECDVLGCSFRRHGFTTRFLRDSHVRHHDRPWKCAVQSCDYAEIGFLSRRMRDEHLDSGHQEAKSQAKLFPSNLDIDEIQPLFFDLIRLDKVEAVNSILHHFNKLTNSVQCELEELVASSGSASMAQVVCNPWDKNKELVLLAKSISGVNFETFRWFRSRIDSVIRENYTNYGGHILQALLKSGSLEMFQECEKYLIDLLCAPEHGEKKQRQNVSLGSFVIQATAGCPVREKFLLSLWAALEMRNATSKFNSKQDLDTALRSVARTTCSLVLTKALLEYGAKSDSSKSVHYPTALHFAARQSSPQAAELMKFLLYHGADPEHQASRSSLKISEEKGAKEIAKWLGMSWDELVQKIKLDRERGICPPEYM